MNTISITTSAPIHGPTIERGTPRPKTHENRFGAALGGPLTPEWGGAKTFFFFNYEGRRFPQVNTYERAVPTKLMRAGVDSGSGQLRQMDALQPESASCNGGRRHLSTRTVRNQQLRPARHRSESGPLADLGEIHAAAEQCRWRRPVTTRRDSVHKFAMPVKSNFLVARVDRDLHPKHRLMLSYRYFHLYQSTTSQVDIGGFFRGQYPGRAEILD